MYFIPYTLYFLLLLHPISNAAPLNEIIYCWGKTLSAAWLTSCRSSQSKALLNICKRSIKNIFEKAMSFEFFGWINQCVIINIHFYDSQYRDSIYGCSENGDCCARICRQVDRFISSYILSCLMIGWGLIRMLWHKIEITLSFILTFLLDKSLLWWYISVFCLNRAAGVGTPYSRSYDENGWTCLNNLTKIRVSCFWMKT